MIIESLKYILSELPSLISQEVDRHVGPAGVLSVAAVCRLQAPGL